ncbi:MAG: ribosome small subunit-dependent GTPase A [Gemmatimonadales bacterium]
MSRRGTVVEREGSTYRVLTDDGEVRASLRKKAKRGQARVLVGDRVTLEPGSSGDLWAIASVDERTSVLARRVPEGRGLRPVVANVEQVVIVTATRNPEPVPQLVDRLLVVAEAHNIPALVVLNKVDLAHGADLAERFHRAGYTVLLTSAKSGDGLPQLREALAGRESVVTGPSGAGKSSLLNALHPGFQLRTGELSERVLRGKHTTVGAVMLPFEGGFVVDTPGFSEVGLWGVEPGDLAQCFPEFRSPGTRCRFGDCRHRIEPGCAVLEEVGTGNIPRDRHDSYLAIMAELESQPKEWE